VFYLLINLALRSLAGGGFLGSLKIRRTEARQRTAYVFRASETRLPAKVANFTDERDGIHPICAETLFRLSTLIEGDLAVIKAAPLRTRSRNVILSAVH
jgi:hypothetical protein